MFAEDKEKEGRDTNKGTKLPAESVDGNLPNCCCASVLPQVTACQGGRRPNQDIFLRWLNYLRLGGSLGSEIIPGIPKHQEVIKMI